MGSHDECEAEQIKLMEEVATLQAALKDRDEEVRRVVSEDHPSWPPKALNEDEAAIWKAAVWSFRDEILRRLGIGGSDD